MWRELLVGTGRLFKARPYVGHYAIYALVTGDRGAKARLRRWASEALR